VSYHRWVVRVSAATAAAVLVLATATAARASVPAGAFVRVERTIDVASFSRTIATRYDIVVRGALTADIDHDGDLDVVASTDRGFLVWVNDGNGQLTSKKPDHTPIVDGCPPDDTWDHGGACDEQTIQNEPPSSKVATAYAHASPSALNGRSDSVNDARGLDPTCGASTPRAPPSSH
jgi:hypothetical protein